MFITLIALLAIAAELHLLFNNKSSICIDYEDLDNLFNRICSEKQWTTRCTLAQITSIVWKMRNLHFSVILFNKRNESIKYEDFDKLINENDNR